MRGAAKSAVLLFLLSIARPAAAERIDVDALPRGELPSVPATRPSGVSATKAIPGLWLSAAPRQERYGTVGLWDEAETAEKFARGEYTDVNTREPTSCFLVDQRADDNDRWPLSGMPFAQVAVHHDASGAIAGQSLYAVRVERLNTAAGGATLDVTDLWLDARSKNMRVIAQHRLSLQRVGEVERGATVYAARGADSVHFVIVPADKRWTGLSRRRLGNAAIEIERGAEVASSACGHASVTVRAPAGGGEAATTKLKVATQWTPGERRSERSLKSAVKRVLGPPRKSPGTAEDFIGEVTVRTLAVHVSAGRPRADRPLLASVAFQWTKEVQTHEL